MEHLQTISPQQQEAISALAQYRNTLIAATKEIMVRDTDYGIIPGVQKPTLLKPGAEKLMNLFNLSVEFECTDKVLDLTTRFLSYTYRCTVRDKNGYIKTQCEGSVNSYEPKYRYTWAEKPKPSQAEQDRLKAEGTGKFRKGNSGWLWVERVENLDVVGLQNTFQKMAQKRALVGAMLLATNASEFYTQDVEDMGFIDVEATIIEPSNPVPTKVEPVQPKPVETLDLSGEIRLSIAQAQYREDLEVIKHANPALIGNDVFKALYASKWATVQRKSVAA